MRKELLKNLKRVAIKIGSSVITHRGEGERALVRGLSEDMVRHFAQQARALVDKGYELVLVSSGAIMAGRKRLGLDRAQLSIPEKQACAAIGQSFLMHTYEKQFETAGLKVAQILLGNDDLECRKRYLNAKNTIDALLAHKVIPIINENDSVTVDEIKIGDNDTLSATVACLANAQLLIILSDVEGLYTRDPGKARKRPEGPPELIALVDNVTEDVEKLAGKSANPLTVGGMYTKVLAAKKTMSFGIPALVVNGLDAEVLDKIFSGKTAGTLFWANKGKIRGRKHWIAHTLKPSGKITVDAGAKKAIADQGRSLLPAGIVGVEGRFEFGNAVRILDDRQKEFARGLVNYNSRDLDAIKGMKTSAVRSIVGNNFYEEVVHRDDLVLL
ncbi:MAG: glutamate 5-kinase [Nitrospinae bacterium]|nr:glutamate 5-kinase [Nitrospinota bacterium]